ncbi:unnamed protein product [Rotaria sordida]|uniref:gamma-glutamylcyclotransferase n=1 Tax=Rotaria sordida TaxID=392033 RepID=A0A819NY44_9BILA|nr:unnamed protein product [Rotaria sordida]
MTEQVSHCNPSLSDANFALSCEKVLSELTRPDQSTIDEILKHDTHDKPEIILPDGRKFVWYFAIGSMINPISLYLRNIIPLISYPAKCRNHKIVFREPSGMADIEGYPEGEFHGVVHLLSDEQMSRLDAMEPTYHRIVVNSINYQEQTHLVYIYKMNIENQPTCLPRERYLDIITKGCEYYKVQPEYINRLKYEQAVIPRRQPHTFQSFTNIPEDVFYSVEELTRHNGNDPTLPLWLSINGKILEYSGLPPVDHPEYEFQKRIYTFAISRLGGREVTQIMAKVFYEPLYVIPSNEKDLCEQHRAHIEDDLYCRINNNQNKSYWKPIGRLRVSDSSL